MELLERKIDDVKFLNVIRKMRKAGYLEDWKFHHTWSGTPQGGIITLPTMLLTLC
jgi:RNA-directed DNA polymerase